MIECPEKLSKLAHDITEGLSKSPKSISSKYLYNAEGDRLFQEITELDAYYLTRREQEILCEQEQPILNLLGAGPLRIIELGPGDGTKTLPLLKKLDSTQSISYQPVDISKDILDTLVENFGPQLSMPIEPLAQDYFQASFPSFPGRSVWLYMGSNIGNLSDKNANRLLDNLANSAREGDGLVIGYDLIKHPERILEAYNDPEGVTAKFNLNLLTRLNQELDANFNINNFFHYPIYDPQAAEARSFLISKIDQDVHIGAVKRDFHFDAHETIATEISRKFSESQLANLVAKSGWRIQKTLTDRKSDYALSFFSI